MVAAMNLESPLNSVGSALLSWLATKRKTTLPVVGSGTTEDTSTVCHGDVNLLQQQQVQGAAVHDKAHSDAVVGSTGPVREGAPLGQIQRARSQAIQRGAESHAIQRARSHSLQRAKINTQLTLQPVDNGVAGSSSSHAAGTVGGAEGGSKGGTEVAMGLRGCAPQATVTPEQTITVKMMRTPLGLGLTVDSQNKVVKIAADSQAQRSGGFAVGRRLISLNGQALSTGVSFDKQLSTIAVGTPVIIEVSMPADRV